MVLTTTTGYFQCDYLLVRAATCTCLCKLYWYFLLFPKAPPNVQTLSRNGAGRPLHTASSCPGSTATAAAGHRFLFCWCSMPLNNRGKGKNAGSEHSKAVFYTSCPPAPQLCPGHPPPRTRTVAGGQQQRRGGRDTWS